MKKNVYPFKPTVLVLLSCYNGQAYLKEQLDSILTQKNCNVELLIRDDGSVDDTVSILKEYEYHYSKSGGSVKILPVLYGKNLGVIRSFFILLQQASVLQYDYYALADQDDIWMEHKLSHAVKTLEKECRKKKSNIKTFPCLYAGAVQPVDTTGKRLSTGMSYSKVRPSFGNALIENICTGCTCVFSKGLLSLLKEKTPNFVIMHDFWLYLVAAAFGTVIYDPQPYIFYRQHENNTVGMAVTRLENYKRRLKNFKRHRGQLSKQAGEFFKIYKNVIPKEKKQLTKLLIKNKRDKTIRKQLLFEKRIYRQNWKDDFIFRIFGLFGLL